MKLATCVFLVLMSACLTVSCTHVPRSTQDPESRADAREQYVKEHPDGKFNSRILEGEVTEGMSAIEVYASWGVPMVRRWTENKADENWTYEFRDKHNDDFVLYELFFADRVLARWTMSRSTAAMGFATAPSLSVAERLSDPVIDRGSVFSNTGAVKKR